MKITFPSSGKVFACLSLLGAASLLFVLGAAVMYFQLPTSVFLRNAFSGAKAWSERGSGDEFSRVILQNPGRGLVNVDKPDKTDDGFTLYATTNGSCASLIDMKGNLVHHWQMPFREVWPHPTHVQPSGYPYWFGCHLFPNGDLLAVFHGVEDTPYGYGLIKLDKDSKLLWAYAGNVHHELDVGDDGTIYALTQKISSKAPEGMDFIPAPFIADALVVLSPEGKELHNIPILEAFRDSKYLSTLELITNAFIRKQYFDPKNPTVALPPDLRDKGDFTHANGVKILRQGLAARFPLFKAGHLLISFRSLDALAVLDMDKRSIVWFSQGCWLAQHAPDFLDNGRLLIYDNGGAGVQSRVLEYDPNTNAIPWSYSNENSKPFLAIQGGKTQRLPNGNTLIVEPDECRVFEVTAGKELVWQAICAGPAIQGMGKVPPAKVTTASRYRVDQLQFLKGETRARP